MFGIGEKKDEARIRAYALKSGAFESKKTAFDYFFIFEGKSAEEAEQLAMRVASARGVPDNPPELTVIDKAKEWIKQGTEMASENPKIADFLIGLVSGAITTAFGVKVGSDVATSEPGHDIDKSAEVKEIE